jgi:head-tail adaptor
MSNLTAAIDRVPAGRRIHRITLQDPGAPVPDGDGGYTDGWADLDPAFAYASIDPASARDIERIASGTTISQAAYIVTMPYHPGVTTKTRLTFNGRALDVVSRQNPAERNVDLVIVAVEVVA